MLHGLPLLACRSFQRARDLSLGALLGRPDRVVRHAALQLVDSSAVDQMLIVQHATYAGLASAQLLTRFVDAFLVPLARHGSDRSRVLILRRLVLLLEGAWVHLLPLLVVEDDADLVLSCDDSARFLRLAVACSATEATRLHGFCLMGDLAEALEIEAHLRL